MFKDLFFNRVLIICISLAQTGNSFICRLTLDQCWTSQRCIGKKVDIIHVSSK